MKVGLWLYGLATVITGMVDIAWRAFDASHQPIQSLGPHIPGHQVLACIAGVWLVAAGMAILWQRTVRIGAAASAVIYLAFALLWLPRFLTMTHSFGFRIGVVLFVLGGIGQQILLVAPAAIIYAASASAEAAWRARAIIAGRWMLGLPPIAFGLAHLINLHVYARFVPYWMPYKLFWVVLTGVAFSLAGIAIVSGIQDVLAARLLALMLLLFEASVEMPPVFAQPHSQVAWGGAVYNLTALGACWIFVEFIESHRHAEQRDVTSAAHYTAAD